MNLSAVIIGALGLAAGSLLVWLPIRVFNRGLQDRKARLGIGLLLALMTYPAMMGPLCWLSSRFNVGADAVTFIYHPVIQSRIDGHCASAVWAAVTWYSELGADSSWHWMIHIPGKGELQGHYVLAPAQYVLAPAQLRLYWGSPDAR